MPLTHYALDKFVAHKVSSLTECGAPELPLRGPWLPKFILTNLLHVTLPAERRAYAFNLLRKAENALSTYKEARSALLEYISTPSDVVSPYFRALSNFETCMAQCFQGFKLLETGSGQRLYRCGDGSSIDRLRLIYNTSKHMDERIENGEIPDEATGSIWITNEGIEAITKGNAPTTLLFPEFHELLTSMSDFADGLCCTLAC